MNRKTVLLAAIFLAGIGLLLFLLRRRTVTVPEIAEVPLPPLPEPTVPEKSPKISPPPVFPQLYLTSNHNQRISAGVLMLISAMLVLYAATLFAGVLPEVTTSREWNWFGAGAVIWVIGVWLLTARRKENQKVSRVALAVMVGIVALAIFVRIYHLTEQPYGVWVDEADAGLEARAMAADANYRPIFRGGIHMTGVQLMTYVAGIKLWGDDIMSLRLISVVWGVLGVIAAYGVGREMRGVWLGLLMAFFLTTMRWSINFSRVAMTGIENPFFVLVTLYFALRLVKYGTLRDALGVAVAIGVGLWFYVSFRIALIPIFMLVLLRWPYWKDLRKTAFLFGIVGITILLLIAPYLIFSQKDPDLFSMRSKETIIFYERNRSEDATVGDVLKDNIPRYLAMFHLEGDQFGRHNLPNAPMLDVVSGLLMLVGLYYAIKHDEWLFLLILVAALITGIITVQSDAPQANRAGAAMVSVVFLCALAVETLGKKLWTKPIPRSAIYSAGAAVLVLVGYLNFETYHHDQRYDYATWESFATAERIFADEFSARADRTILLSQQPPFPMHGMIAHYLEPRLGENLAEPPFISILDFPLRTSGNTSVFLMPEETSLLAYAQMLYPNAKISTVRYDAPGLINLPETIPILFYVVDINAEDIAAVQGLSSQNEGFIYFPVDGLYRFSADVTLDGGLIEAESVRRLAQGLHSLVALESGVLWSTPLSDGYVPIPNTFLFHDVGQLHGLTAMYYLNDQWQGDPAVIRRELMPSQHYHNAPVPRPFSVKWQGMLEIPVSGTYHFAVRQSGQTEVYLGEALILATDEPQTLVETEVALDAGNYEIEIRYQSAPDAQIYLYWQPPDGSREPLPPLFLSPQ